MAHPAPPIGLEDPFVRPPAALTAFPRDATHPDIGQRMRALSHTSLSRLNSAKIRRGSESASPGSRKTPPIYSFVRSSSLKQLNNVSVSTSSLVSLNISPLHTINPAGSSAGTRKGPDLSPASRSKVQQSLIQAGISASSHFNYSIGPALLSKPIRVAPIPPSHTVQRENGPTSPPSISVHSTTPQHGLISTEFVVMNDGPISPLTPVQAIHHCPARPPSTGPYLEQFTLFGDLPAELQQEIWSIAISVQYYNEKRFLRVAPDSESLERTDDESTDAQLRIISDVHRRPRMVPTLLHACHYSRKEAIKGYELWGCADPITYEDNDAKIYVKMDIDAFFFGDADLENFWVFHTLMNESEPETEDADDTARTNFVEQIGMIKHFTFDYELWIQILEYDALWLANFDSANQLTIAVRNPNHEDLKKDYALRFMRPVIPGTFRNEAARIISAMTFRYLGESRHELSEMNWPESGRLQINVRSLSTGPSIGNSAEDEYLLEDVLIEGNRSGLISDRYLESRLTVIHQDHSFAFDG
ncbi:hypothetical protein WAI453_013439 [Rhynchosporium graminicola]